MSLTWSRYTDLILITYALAQFHEKILPKDHSPRHGEQEAPVRHDRFSSLISRQSHFFYKILKLPVVAAPVRDKQHGAKIKGV